MVVKLDQLTPSQLLDISGIFHVDQPAYKKLLEQKLEQVSLLRLKYVKTIIIGCGPTSPSAGRFANANAGTRTNGASDATDIEIGQDGENGHPQERCNISGVPSK